MTEADNVQDAADSSETKAICWLSYLGILFLVPLYLCRDSSYARFHVNQGIVYFIFSLIVGFAAVAAFEIPRAGAVISLVLYAILVFYMIHGVANALSGKKKKLPLIGRIVLYR